ncbi:aldo/keto reductase [Eubacteriales bacterium mix99]
MEYTKFGQTDLNVSVLALGTGSYFSNIPDDVSERMLNLFYEEGGNLYDTANYYGRWKPGNKPLSEINLGKWIKKNNMRHRIVLATKGACYFSNRPDLPRVTPKYIEEDLHESLKNLQTDYIDFYWLHQDDVKQPVEEIIDILNRFVKEGKIRWFGCSNWKVERMKAADDYASKNGLKTFYASQVMMNLAVPNMEPLNELKQSWVGPELQKYYVKEKMPLAAYTSQAMGIYKLALRDDFLTNPNFHQARRYFLNEGTTSRVIQVKKLSQKTGMTPIQICLGYLQSQKFQVIPIIGPRNENELRESLEGAGCKLLAEEMSFIING